MKKQNPPVETTLKGHVAALSERRGGKPTEGVLMRFNEREFYLLNLAAQHAATKGYTSRQAWMRRVMLDALKKELGDDAAMQTLLSNFLHQSYSG